MSSMPLSAPSHPLVPDAWHFRRGFNGMNLGHQPCSSNPTKGGPTAAPTNISIMGTALSKLPPIYVSPSRELSNVAMVAARDAGLSVEQQGIALLESVEPPLVLNYDLTPWLTYLAGLAGEFTQRLSTARLPKSTPRCFGASREWFVRW